MTTQAKPITLTPGRYLARVVQQVFATNTKGNPELRLTVQPYADADGNQFPFNALPTPKTVFMTLTPATIGTPEKPGWVWETLRFLGFYSTDIGTLDPNHPTAFDLKDKEITILCSEDEYMGKKRFRYSILRYDHSAGPPAKDAIAKFNAQHADMLARFNKPQPQPEPDAPF